MVQTPGERKRFFVLDFYIFLSIKRIKVLWMPIFDVTALIYTIFPEIPNFIVARMVKCKYLSIIYI